MIPLRLLAAVIASLLASAAQAGPMTARGVVPARSTAEELARATQPLRVAVVIGVNSYQSPVFEPLSFAAADADALGALLTGPDVGGFDRVEVLVGPARTGRAAVLAELRDLAATLGREDVVIVYFSGHGAAALGPDGDVRRYLLPHDASPADLAATAIDLHDLETYFAKLPPLRKALIVDACFNGQGKSTIDPRLDAAALARPPADPAGLSSGEARLFATSLGRPAFEDDGLGGGVYSYFLRQAMTWALPAADTDQDGLITAYEAHDYARGRVIDHTDGQQVPEAAIRVLGLNDVVLAGSPVARAQQDLALVYDYGGEAGDWAGTLLLVDGRAKGAFPGAVSVEPGRHHLELRGPGGQATAAGYVVLREGQDVPVRELTTLLRQDHMLVGVRGGVLAGPAASWGATWGPGNLAVEATAAVRRVRAPLPGLILGGAVGVAVSPQRAGVDGLVHRARGTAWLALDVGWATELQRFRLRLSWQGRCTVVPIAALRSQASAGAYRPEEVGWMVFSQGPSVTLGAAVDRRVNLVTGIALQASPFRLDADHGVRLHPFAAWTAGLEVAL